MNVTDIDDEHPQLQYTQSNHLFHSLGPRGTDRKALSGPDSPGYPFWFSSQRNIPRSTPVFLPHKEKRKRRRFLSSLCVLAVLLVFFMVFSVIITSLFLWHMQFLPGADCKSPTSSSAPPSPPQPTGCRGLPDPVSLRVLPKSIVAALRGMDDLIKKEISSGHAVSAISNIIYRDKIIWSGAYGVMGRGEQPPREPNTSTVFPIASVSKVLTALLLFKLYNDNKISSLDEPVVNFEPNFDVRNPHHDHKMTLKELAAMRSGFQREAPCYPDNSTNLCPHDHVTMIRRIRNLTLVHDPSKRPQYSNLGYAVLGQVLARRFSGEDFEALIRKEIFKPLGMNSSSTFLPSQVKHLPIGYLNELVRSPIEWGWLAPSAGMFSTVDDLAKMEIELMTDNKNNRFLSRKITEEFLTNAYILPDGTHMIGTPWEMEIRNGTIHRNKQGSVFGHESFTSLIPELRLAFNLLCTDCKFTLRRRLTYYYVTKVVPLFEQELRKVNIKKLVLPPDPDAFIGHYTTSSIPGLTSFDITLKDGELIFGMMGSDFFHLNYTAPLTFELLTLPGETCDNTYMLGADNDIIVFTEPSARDGLSHRFAIFAAHPSGRTYADRVLTKRTASKGLK